MTTIAPVERLANLGYGALIKQTDVDTPLTPTTYFPLYKESLMTDLHLDLDEAIVGNRMKVQTAFQGQRGHTGSLSVLAEPGSAQYWFGMMLKPGSVTGTTPNYTHPFSLDIPPDAYTIDFLKGQMVERFWGVEAQSIEAAYEKNKMVFNVEVAARGSFISRTVATVSTVTITLDTTYDPEPTKGLVAGDRVRLYKSDQTAYIDTTVSTVSGDGITVVLNGSAAGYTGATLFLRAGTPDVDVNALTPFTWARTEFHFDDTVANAISNTHTPIEQGAKWKLMSTFENKEGALRSGSYDPASLPRTTGEATLTLKQFLDQPFDRMRYLNVEDRACVIRHFSGSGHELRITLNALKQKGNKDPLDTGGIIYQEIEYEARYKASNSENQGFLVQIINANAS